MTTQEQIKKLRADAEQIRMAAYTLRGQGLTQLAVQASAEADKIDATVRSLTRDAEHEAGVRREAELTDKERRVLAVLEGDRTVLRAYRGKVGCQCGCLGTHWYTEAGVAQMNEDDYRRRAGARDAQVKRVVRDAIDRVYSGDYRVTEFSEEYSPIVMLDYTTPGGTEMTITIEVA